MPGSGRNFNRLLQIDHIGDTGSPAVLPLMFIASRPLCAFAARTAEVQHHQRSSGASGHRAVSCPDGSSSISPVLHVGELGIDVRVVAINTLNLVSSWSILNRPIRTCALAECIPPLAACCEPACSSACGLPNRTRRMLHPVFIVTVRVGNHRARAPRDFCGLRPKSGSLTATSIRFSISSASTQAMLNTLLGSLDLGALGARPLFDLGHAQRQILVGAEYTGTRLNHFLHRGTYGRDIFAVGLVSMRLTRARLKSAAFSGSGLCVGRFLWMKSIMRCYRPTCRTPPGRAASWYRGGWHRAPRYRAHSPAA